MSDILALNKTDGGLLHHKYSYVNSSLVILLLRFEEIINFFDNEMSLTRPVYLVNTEKDVLYRIGMKQQCILSGFLDSANSLIDHQRRFSEVIENQKLIKESKETRFSSCINAKIIKALRNANHHVQPIRLATTEDFANNCWYVNLTAAEIDKYSSFSASLKRQMKSKLPLKMRDIMIDYVTKVVDHHREITSAFYNENQEILSRFYNSIKEISRRHPKLINANIVPIQEVDDLISKVFEGRLIFEN